MKMVLMRSLQLEHRIVTCYMAQNSMVPWKIKDIMKITIFLILSKSEKKMHWYIYTSCQYTRYSLLLNTNIWCNMQEALSHTHQIVIFTDKMYWHFEKDFKRLEIMPWDIITYKFLFCDMIATTNFSCLIISKECMFTDYKTVRKLRVLIHPCPK